MKSPRTIRNKADKLFQEKGRKLYTACEVCGKPYSCLHHYYPKSTSTALRYDMDNAIPLCHGCHFAHHNGDPRIHNTVNQKRGKAWLNRLNKKKKTAISSSVAFYRKELERLTAELEEFDKPLTEKDFYD